MTFLFKQKEHFNKVIRSISEQKFFKKRLTLFGVKFIIFQEFHFYRVLRKVNYFFEKVLKMFILFTYKYLKMQLNKDFMLF